MSLSVGTERVLIAARRHLDIAIAAADTALTELQDAAGPQDDRECVADALASMKLARLDLLDQCGKHTLAAVPAATRQS